MTINNNLQGITITSTADLELNKQVKQRYQSYRGVILGDSLEDQVEKCTDLFQKLNNPTYTPSADEIDRLVCEKEVCKRFIQERKSLYDSSEQTLQGKFLLLADKFFKGFGCHTGLNEIEKAKLVIDRIERYINQTPIVPSQTYVNKITNKEQLIAAMKQMSPEIRPKNLEEVMQSLLFPIDDKADLVQSKLIQLEGIEINECTNTLLLMKSRENHWFAFIDDKAHFLGADQVNKFYSAWDLSMDKPIVIGTATLKEEEVPLSNNAETITHHFIVNKPEGGPSSLYSIHNHHPKDFRNT